MTISLNVYRLRELFTCSHSLENRCNEDLQAVIVLNQCQPQQVLTKDAMEILKDFQAGLYPTMLHSKQRQLSVPTVNAEFLRHRA